MRSACPHPAVAIAALPAPLRGALAGVSLLRAAGRCRRARRWGRPGAATPMNTVISGQYHPATTATTATTDPAALVRAAQAKAAGAIAAPLGRGSARPAAQRARASHQSAARAPVLHTKSQYHHPLIAVSG